MKDPRVYQVTHEDGASTFLIDPQAAKARRDIMSPLFSRRAILELEYVIQEKVSFV